MKYIKNLFIAVVAGMVLGLWFGVNIGKDKALLSNPFTEETLQKKIKQTGGEVLEKSGKVIEERGKALQEQLKP
jgi:hypothetical protein